MRRQARSQTPPGCLDAAALMKAIVRDSNRVDLQNLRSYDVSYPEFLLFFEMRRD